MTEVLLQVDSSPRAGSATRSLTSAYAAAWRDAGPDREVRHHDLPTLNVPHLNATEMGAWFDDPNDHTDLHHLVLARSNVLIDDVLEADELVIGAPMWNFSIPSALKAWIDHVVRNGRTIQYAPGGLQGTVTARRAVVICASGSDYAAGSRSEGLNLVEPYMRQILGFLGIDRIDHVQVNRQGPNWPDAADVLQAAHAQVCEMAAEGVATG